MGLIRSCFARTQTWLQAGKYLNALVSDLPSRNGWTAGEQEGDRSPAKSQRLLNRASWDEAAAMSQVRKYAAAGLDAAARRSRRRRMTVGALDETGQEKQGGSTAGVKRQYMGCAGRVANGINTVHLSYVREKTGHALAGARQWIPAEDIRDPVKSLVTGLPLDLRFRTKGELAADVLADAYGDGLSFNFVCGDEVYGACTALREFLEGRGQAYVLRIASNFTLTLAAGTVLTCAETVKKLLGRKRGWEVRSAGQGSKGERWYAWAWLGTASPWHSLLVRRHLKTGELAFHYCFAALHRDPAPRCADHGRPRDLRRHRCPAQGPDRHPGPGPRQARRPPARRSRPRPAQRPGDQETARPDFGQISAQVGLLNRFPAHQAGQPRSALPCRSPGSPRRWSRSLPSSPLCQ